MRGKWYQLSLIFLGVLVTALFSIFFLRELFPEYKIYQNAYVELEKFRSSYTGEPPPPFEMGVKQILITQGTGPEKIDRCISCHVALQFEHFSPTVIAKDINGNTIYDSEGIPKKVPNENYIWTKLDEKIQFLLSQNKTAEAEKFKALKTARAGEHIYDMTAALRMHPLIGRETRPFEFHPIDEYGCTVCHGGNGRGLTTDKAHGPVFDGQYEEQYMGPEPQFLELDPENDPPFSRVFNHKPGHRLLFQTTPLLVGSLIEANCVQCHQGNDGKLLDAARNAASAVDRRKQESRAIEKAFENEKKAFLSYVELRRQINKDGYQKTIESLRESAVDFTLPVQERSAKGDQLDFLLRLSDGEKSPPADRIIGKIDEELTLRLGSKELVFSYLKQPDSLDAYLKKHKGEKGAAGSLFVKMTQLERDKEQMAIVGGAEKSIDYVVDNEKVVQAFHTNIDSLIKNFHQGENLYISQACYACHRIAGFARGGVGPELTNEGNSYPWFIKESIVWPQADLKTSTMPNFRMDHDEVEDLVTFLLAQHGRNKAVSESDFKKKILDWEAGAKMPWEKPINPGRLRDIRYAMTVFASEGCAACHQLKGFDSNVGFLVEKEAGNKSDFYTVYPERQWFNSLFPLGIHGSDIVNTIDKHKEEIDKKIVSDARDNGLLEEIEDQHPGLIESFYSNFKYASRAKNHHYEQLAEAAENPEEKAAIQQKLNDWKDLVHRVLMVYIQEHGLGRLIGPRPNWSGIYRSDAWLIEHFRKPSQHTAKSIMPVMPFDDSKFYSLTYMLDEIGKKNLDNFREVWDHVGFQPEQAYQLLCSQCHGQYLHGNGPVAEWIYPIPKNLRNADFLTNYTRENVINSITHGVKGTPMPPWGETAPDKPFENHTPVLTKSEIEQLADWLFSSLLSGTTLKTEEEVAKWEYGADDVIEELRKEKNQLQPGPAPEFIDLKEIEPPLGWLQRREADQYYAALKPVVNNTNGSTPARQDGEVAQIFDIIPNPPGSPEKDGYYIKEKYYTEENIQQGQKFFELNCAVCHGREADGQGFRAGTMFDAKPRMLTNLHWLATRDDLRMIRSIKYGVAGTAMTPWGDLTSSLQRLQLVIFIRSLSTEQKQRDELFETLYQVFDVADQTIDTARIGEYKKVNELQEKLAEINIKRAALFAKIEEGAAPAEAVELYKNELAFTQKERVHRQADELLEELKKLVKQEGTLYQRAGILLIGKTFVGKTFGQYLELLENENGSYKIENGRLKASFDADKEKEAQKLGNDIVETISKQTEEMENELKVVKAMLPSEEREEKLSDLNGEYKKLQDVKHSLIAVFAETARLRKKQQKVYNQYLKKIEEIHGNQNRV